MELTRNHNPKLFSFIQELSAHQCFVEDNCMHRNNIVSISQQSKFIFYKSINPDCTIHEVYTRKRDYIPEHYRMAFTRMRLSSHRLRIETGRWARLPRERRLCPCGLVQDEQHVLVECPLVSYIRDAYAQAAIFPDVLQYASDRQDFVYIYDILRYFE